MELTMHDFAAHVGESVRQAREIRQQQAAALGLQRDPTKCVVVALRHP
jgi:hypothetical protein